MLRNASIVCSGIQPIEDATSQRPAESWNAKWELAR